jgi:hypothetical protein
MLETSRRRSQRPLFHAVIMIATIALTTRGWAAMTQEVDPQKVAAVKAHMLVNFVKYTEWPSDSFPEEKSPIVITVVGQSDIEESLRRAVRNQSVNGREIELRWVRYPQPRTGETSVRAEDLSAFHQRLRASHAVYFADSERNRITTMLRALEGSNVLTVSDIPEFAEKGGMLGFAIREQRVAFDANPDEIAQTRLSVSSKVLKLARIVKTQGDETR